MVFGSHQNHFGPLPCSLHKGRKVHYVPHTVFYSDLLQNKLGSHGIWDDLLTNFYDDLEDALV